MIKITQFLLLTSTFLVLTGCGEDHPKLTNYKAFDERFTTVIDTSDADLLQTLGDLFFDRELATGVEGNLDFVYLIDITMASGSERWRCTKTGYCQQRVQGAAPHREIYFLERHRELYDLSKLN